MNHSRLALILLAVGLFLALAGLLAGLNLPWIPWIALNVLAAFDKLLGAWVLFPPALSWALAGFVLGALCYFAVWEARRVGQRHRRHGYLVIAGLLLVLSPLAWRSVEALSDEPILWWPASADSRAGEMRTFDNMAFVWVPPGRYRMGSPRDELNRRAGEQPHIVSLRRGFWLGRTEVTQAQWAAVMGVNPSYFQPGGDDHPVDNVSYDDCRAFIQRLNALTGNRYRLPTEAEWEYACRAGESGAYAFGNDPSRLGEYAWYRDNSEGRTRPVATRKPNAWGLYDMHGNVREWCQDWFGPYRDHTPVNPQGPAQGVHRLLRGGGWDSSADECRSAARYVAVQDGPPRHPGFGLRLVRDP